AHAESTLAGDSGFHDAVDDAVDCYGHAIGRALSQQATAVRTASGEHPAALVPRQIGANRAHASPFVRHVSRSADPCDDAHAAPLLTRDKIVLVVGLPQSIFPMNAAHRSSWVRR